MGQYFARETGHNDEGNAWQRDISGKSQEMVDDRNRYSDARRGAKAEGRYSHYVEHTEALHSSTT